MVVILCAFCSVIKHHELLPIAIWSNMTHIRQVAPLLHIINFNNLCFRVENKTTLISAKNRVDLSSISEVRSYITEWPRFFGATLYNRCFSVCCLSPAMSLELWEPKTNAQQSLPNAFAFLVSATLWGPLMCRIQYDAIKQFISLCCEPLQVTTKRKFSVSLWRHVLLCDEAIFGQT